MVRKHWNSHAHSHVAGDLVTSYFCYTYNAVVNVLFMSPCMRHVRIFLGYIPRKKISTIHYAQLQFLRVREFLRAVI